MKKHLSIAILITIPFLAGAQSWPAGIHDPSSIVKEGDTYWVFGTGQGIESKYSKDMVTWVNGPSPFPGDFPAWILNYAKTDTDQFDGFFWAPDIIHMNDKYYLYYSCSVWGTMNSCIGVVVNKTLDPADPDYEWVDQGDIGIYSSGGYINAIDPAVMRGHDGKIWLTYGSFNRDGIVVTEADSVTGRPLNPNKTSIANSYTGGGRYGEGEGGCIIYHENYYYLFYNKGGCCNGIASSYYMVVGRATHPQGPYFDKNNNPLRVINGLSGGNIVFKHDDSRGLDDRYFGPGHFGLYRENGVDYVSFHYYDPNGYYPSEEANFMGGPTLGLAKLVWGEDGWPRISMDFLEEGFYTIENVNSSKYMDLKNQVPNEGTGLFQYSADSLAATQKWLFTPLGTGEYTIRNYADLDKYLEASGTDNSEILRVTSGFAGEINKKFRVVKSTDDKLLIYPSTKNKIMEIPNAYLFDFSIRLFSNTNHDCQRWYAHPFHEEFSLSSQNIVFDYMASANESVIISSNGSWDLTIIDSSWISATPLSGTGNDTLSIVVKANDNMDDRSGQLTISTKAGKSADLFVTQKGIPNTHIESGMSGDFSIYPNPSNGIIVVETESFASLEIYDLSGKLQESFKIKNSITRLDLRSLDSGVYIFKLNHAKGPVLKKVIRL